MTDTKDSFVITLTDNKTVSSSVDKTLLESLESAGIEVHYHCREGFCGACRTQLLEGEVEYTTDPLAYFEDDEILPCCCKATSDIKISIVE